MTMGLDYLSAYERLCFFFCVWMCYYVCVCVLVCLLVLHDRVNKIKDSKEITNT